MKIDVFDFNEFIELNLLKEVTSPIVFARGGTADPNGLLSNDIFGIDTKSRKNTFAYASLHGHFFHPHIYKSLRRLYRNIERIVAGTEYYSITQDGELVRDDEKGHTGIEWIYKNWDKIDWSKKLDEESSSMREERVSLLKELKKNEIFIDKIIIIPVFYRDILVNSSGGGETDPLNNMYTKLIRLGKVLADRDMFDFTLYSTTYMMQNTIVEIYDTFKHKIEKKNGMIRKYLMGKNVDNCVRSVISCPLYHDDTPEDTGTKFGYVGTPISQILDLDAPFMMNWLKSFFDRNFITNKEQVPTIQIDPNTGERKIEYIQLYKPELIFTDKYFTNMMELYMRDPESRFDPIKVPVAKDKYKDVLFTGKRLDPTTHAEISNIASRPMTVTDLFYIAAMDITKNQHALITRYPVSDAYGLFVARVNPVSTLMTEVVQVNGQVYTHYPKQDTSCTRENTGVQFIDTLQFSNSYLAGLGGDYDGDQVTMKLIWSLEANNECERIMNDKSFFVSPNGQNVRTIKYEVYQTFYDMTREPNATSKHVPNEVKDELLKKPAKDFTFTYLRDLFGNTSMKDKNGKVYTKKSRFEVNDIIHLEANEYHNKMACDTTIGRLCWNKIMIDRIDLRRFFPYMNDVLIKKRSSKFESDVTQLLVDDKIDTHTFRDYINHRDWLGLQLHGIITVSFTEKTIKTPESVKKLRDELFKKYEKDLDDGDIVVAGKIEKELIGKMVDIIKDDPGFDLYNSGARGDINNHMKNLFIMRGGVLNPNTGKYDIMKTSFNEGLRKEDFTAASSSVVQGAYPKAVGEACA